MLIPFSFYKLKKNCGVVVSQRCPPLHRHLPFSFPHFLIVHIRLFDLTILSTPTTKNEGKADKFVLTPNLIYFIRLNYTNYINESYQQQLRVRDTLSSHHVKEFSRDR